jgi:hypothetical protein
MVASLKPPQELTIKKLVDRDIYHEDLSIRHKKFNYPAPLSLLGKTGSRFHYVCIFPGNIGFPIVNIS